MFALFTSAGTGIWFAAGIGKLRKKSRIWGSTSDDSEMLHPGSARQPEVRAAPLCHRERN
jgi:hypothetical protein